MRKQYAKFFLFCMALLVYCFTPVKTNAAPSFEPDIRVGLWSNQSSVLVSADTDFEIINSVTKEVLGNTKAKEKVAVSINDSGILINNKLTDAKRINVVVKSEAALHYIEINKRWYRGDIEIYPTANQKRRITVVNTLPLEQYLYGVIAKEISPDWPIEAVKAQAVAARTYALTNFKKHLEDGYDVCATSDCQVYGGKDSESPRVLRAVDETRGLIIAYQGKPINAYYSSSSGGYTENSENVWGTYLPYIRAVADQDQASPYFKWEKTLTIQELDNLVAKAGYKIGSIQAIALSVLAKPPMTQPDRGISGRVKYLRLIGTTGSIQLTGEKFRNMVTLNSTLFDIKIVSPIQKNIQFTITDTAGQQENKSVEINLPPSEGTVSVIDKANLRRITDNKNEIVIITGAGWGHGLGLSQWGAKAMAEKAANGDAEYFKEILKHYYQGVEIKRYY